MQDVLRTVAGGADSEAVAAGTVQRIRERFNTKQAHAAADLERQVRKSAAAGRTAGSTADTVLPVITKGLFCVVVVV